MRARAVRVREVLHARKRARCASHVRCIRTISYITPLFILFNISFFCYYFIIVFNNTADDISTPPVEVMYPVRSIVPGLGQNPTEPG